MQRLVLAVLFVALVVVLAAWAAGALFRLGARGRGELDEAVAEGNLMQNIAFALLLALIVYVSFFGGA